MQTSNMVVRSTGIAVPEDPNKCVESGLIIFDERISPKNHFSESNSALKTSSGNDFQTLVIQKSRLSELYPIINLAFALGFVPIPLQGKKPILPNWTNIQKEGALDAIHNGFNNFNADNIGIICGKHSGIVVLDIDIKNEGLNTWNQLIATHGDPYTFKMKTGSGGYHYYFKYDSDNEMLKSRSGAIKINGVKVGIDIKTNGGQVVFIGSIHPDTKKTYEWVNNNPQGDQSVPPINKMPVWVLSLLLETESRPQTPINVSSSPLIIGSNSPIVKNENAPPPMVSEDTLTELINRLNADRASNYNDWIKVIWAIKTVSPDYYHIAQHFSMRTQRNNYDEAGLQKVWNEGKGLIGMGSLLYWLKWDVDAATYEEFLEKHGLNRWPAIPPCDETNEGINSHENKITWHSVLMKYHGKSVNDVQIVVKDVLQCVALVVGADEVYFVKESYDKYDALQYNLAKSSKFESIANKYYFMEVKRLNDGSIKRMTWSFKELISTFLSRIPYNRIDFSPAGNIPGIVNTFTGLRVKRISNYNVTLIAPILNHIKEVLCNEDMECTTYFINKLACFFQNLGIKKLGVADLIISPQGIGKNLFYEHLGRYVLGEQYWYVTSDIHKLTGRFNKAMMGKLLIIGDEAKGHGKTAEAIKPMITQEVQWIEPKGFEQFKISDWAMYAFFANSARYFEVEDSDRRYLVLRGNEKYKGDKSYFDKLSETFQKYGDIFYSFLMDRDIRSFNIQRIPCTPLKCLLQETSGSSCRVFLKTWGWKKLKHDPNHPLQYCEDGEIPIGGRMALGDLHAQYVIWCERNGISKIDSKIAFAKDLADLLIPDNHKIKWITRTS